MTPSKTGRETATTNIKVRLTSRDLLNSRKAQLKKRLKRRRFTQSDAIDWLCLHVDLEGQR